MSAALFPTEAFHNEVIYTVEDHIAVRHAATQVFPPRHATPRSGCSGAGTGTELMYSLYGWDIEPALDICRVRAWRRTRRRNRLIPGAGSCECTTYSIDILLRPFLPLIIPLIF